MMSPNFVNTFLFLQHDEVLDLKSVKRTSETQTLISSIWDPQESTDEREVLWQPQTS